MYKIVAAYTLENLALEISKLINDKYVPVGGLVMVVTQKSMHYSSVEEYAQAVCRSLVPYKEDN